jgi:Peptidyl-tRNA hydrolase PTH2
MPVYMEPILYILLRNDLESMTNGRKMAQVSHAATNADRVLRGNTSLHNGILEELYIEWSEGTADGFGTTIVLGSESYETHETQDFKKFKLAAETIPLNIKSIHRLVDEVNMWYQHDIIGRIITDLTYGILDGTYIHSVPVETAGWLFGRRQHLEKWTKNLVLQT